MHYSVERISLCTCPLAQVACCPVQKHCTLWSVLQSLYFTLEGCFVQVLQSSLIFTVLKDVTYFVFSQYFTFFYCTNLCSCICLMSSYNHLGTSCLCQFLTLSTSYRCLALLCVVPCLCVSQHCTQEDAVHLGEPFLHGVWSLDGWIACIFTFQGL